MKPIICIDFDGVLHSGNFMKLGPPVEGSVEFLNEAVKHFDVCIFSVRNFLTGGIPKMRDWFREYFPDCYEQLHFPKEKPSAIMFIDDRAFTFKGKFPDIEYIKNFKAWDEEKNGVMYINVGCQNG